MRNNLLLFTSQRQPSCSNVLRRRGARRVRTKELHTSFFHAYIYFNTFFFFVPVVLQLNFSAALILHK